MFVYNTYTYMMNYRMLMMMAASKSFDVIKRARAPMVANLLMLIFLILEN